MPTVDNSLKTCVSELIIADILNGKLQPGKALCSKRQLATKYAVSRTVIDRVLENLSELGYVKRLESGHYIVLNFNKFEDFNDLINFSKFNNQSLSIDEVNQIKHFKAGLDALSIKLIKLPISKEDYFDLIGLISPLHYCENSEDIKVLETYATTIYDFYYKLACMSNNVFIPWIYCAFRNTNIKIITHYLEQENIKYVYKKASNVARFLYEGEREEALKIIDENLN